MIRVRSLLVACLIGAAAACSDDTPTTPTTPTPTTFTEVFSGTINRNGATSHSFISQTSGSVTATLTSVTPDATQVLGLALGTWTGTACQIIIAADRATQSVQISGSVGSAGSLCARVYDVGTITDDSPVTYEVTVVHP